MAVQILRVLIVVVVGFVARNVLQIIFDWIKSSNARKNHKNHKGYLHNRNRESDIRDMNSENGVDKEGGQDE